MTKYFLHGGDFSTDVKSNRDFLLEYTKTIPDGGTVLLVLFAIDEPRRAGKVERTLQRFSEWIPDKKFKFVIADEIKLIDQIKSADAIFIKGGDNDMLINVLKKHPEFKFALIDKIVAGFSAGAYALSKYYYTRDKEAIESGLGILNVKCVGHFTGDQSIVDRLKTHGEDLPIVAVPECEYKVIEV